MKKNKNYVKEDFIKMIENSWTYNKLTKKEKENIMDILYSGITEKALKGTYEQRWKILQLIYYSFLIALDYQAINWRENKDVPSF